MDRDDTFKIASHSWLSVSGISEFVIVDWSSSIPISEVASEVLQDPRVKLVTVKLETKWVLSWAYNLAARYVPLGSMMLKVDCDTVLSADVLVHHPMEENMFYAGNWKDAATENGKHLNGILYINHSYFSRVNGFDERLQTYGNDDNNLYERLNASGLTVKRFDITKMYHLDHSDSLRSSRQAPHHLKFEVLKNRQLQALLPPWNRKCTQTSYNMTPSGDLRGHFLVYRQTTVPSLEVLLPERLTTAVKRNTSQILLRAQHIPWSSLNLSTAYLIQMIPSYDSGRMLIVHVQDGLGSRLRALASGMVIASKTGRHFRLIWTPDSHCEATFDDLFLHDMDVWKEFESGEVNGENFDCYDYTAQDSAGLRIEKIQTDSANHIYVKTASMLLHDEVTSKAMHESVSLLQLRSSIAAEVTTVNASALFGLHIRALNCSGTNGELIDDACLQTRAWQGSKTSQPVLPALFGTQIDNILEKNAQQKFFLATDSLTVKSELKKRYPEQIKSIDIDNCVNRSKRCVALAAAELWILGSTVEIFGSPLSSFAQVAGFIGNKRVKYAALHFPDLQSDHLTGPELVTVGNGIIYTTYSFSKNETHNSERNGRIAELLKSAKSFHDGLNGTVPISLFTDHQTRIPPSHTSLFKSILRVNLSYNYSGKETANRLPDTSADKKKEMLVHLGIIQRLAMSPYEVTFYLDPRTWLCENLTNFTKILGNDDIIFGKTIHVKSKSHLAWNSDIILYRSSPIVKRFFRLWEALYVRQYLVAGPERKETYALSRALALSPLLRYKAS